MSSHKSYFNDALRQLKSAGFSTPFGDCRRLLKYSMDHDSIFNSDASLVDKHIRKIFKFSIRRRLSDEPISHIVGFRDFWKSKFMVNQGVLDPRPETELIVEKVIASALSGASILELGTGTGCIATSIALERPDLKICASEISLEALNVAKKTIIAVATTSMITPMLYLLLHTRHQSKQMFDSTSCCLLVHTLKA